MGFLDHSTNNIILDAVLTDYGRQQLSLVNSSFNITHFSFGDDEVDYRMIKRYGRAVGKEKIEKNTPIFEAMTNPNTALKYKLIGRENVGPAGSAVFLPVLIASPASVALSISTASAASPSKPINLSLRFQGTPAADALRDVAQTSYQIKISDRFFTLSNPVNGVITSTDAARSSISQGDPNRTAVYIFSVTDPTQPIGITVNARSLDATTKSVYGKKTSASERTISSVMTVIGNRHGTSIDIPITYVVTSA